MSRSNSSFVTLFLALLLAGCGGGGGSDAANDSGDDNVTAEAVITGDNAAKVAREGAKGLNGVAGTVDDLHAVMDDFSMMSNRDPNVASVQKYTANGADETINCAGGGTLTVSSDNTSGTGATLHYVADDCTAQNGDVVNGELILTTGAWSEYPESGFEFTMETGSEGLSTSACEFDGGIVMRVASIPATEQYGEHFFAYEYGATDEGFAAFCEPDQETRLAANTVIHHEFSYSWNEDGSMTAGSSVSFDGSIETEDGDVMDVTATDLAYGVSENGDSLYGEPDTCPTAGSMTLTANDGSSVSIYFGEDAPSGYEVQVTGPDGYVGEFETCEDFMDASS